MFRKPLLALSCCALLAGCNSFDPIGVEFRKLTNPFGTPFQNRAEVSEHVKAGMPVEDAQTELNAHGYEQWSSQSHGDTLTLLYHQFDYAGLKETGPVGWLTLRCEGGTVVDVQCQQEQPRPNHP